MKFLSLFNSLYSIYEVVHHYSMILLPLLLMIVIHDISSDNGKSSTETTEQRKKDKIPPNGKADIELNEKKDAVAVAMINQYTRIMLESMDIIKTTYRWDLFNTHYRLAKYYAAQIIKIAEERGFKADLAKNVLLELEDIDLVANYLKLNKETQRSLAQIINNDSRKL